MAHKKFDAVQQLATGSGVGALTLGAATSAKYRTMQVAGMVDGDTMDVRIEHETIPAEWEEVRITYAAGAITREFDDAASSATGALIEFSAGNKIVSNVLRARKAVVMDNNDDASVIRALVVGDAPRTAENLETALGVDTLVDFRAIESSPPFVLAKGRDSVNDGWEGLFVRNDTDTTTADDGILTIVTAAGKRYNRLYSGPLKSVWWHLKANGDGEQGGTDVVAFGLQAAIDFANARGVRDVVLPTSGTGTYRWVATLQMKSDVTLDMSGVVLDHLGVNANMWSFTGTIGSAINTTASLTRNDTTISTETAHGGTTDDIFVIQGPRNALSSAAGDWRCGNGTAGLPVTRFAEWLPVAATPSDTSFVSAVPLEFPDYLIEAAAWVTATGYSVNDRVLEAGVGYFCKIAHTSGTFATDLAAGNWEAEAAIRTTVKKVTPVRNAHVKGGTILANDSVNQTSLSTSLFAVECTVEGVTILRGNALGRSLSWAQSYKCVAKGVKNIGAPVPDWDYSDPDEGHASRNRFIQTSSQDCDFIECEDEYGAQSVDLTYNSFGVCFRPHVLRCTFNRSYEGPTSHPGVYQDLWDGCKFLNCLNDGLLLRGLQPTVRGCTFSSSTELLTESDSTKGEPSHGVLLNGGHAKGAKITDNKFSGFRYAAAISNTGADPENCFTTIDALIAMNSITDCYAGMLVDCDTLASDALRGVVFKGNDLRRMQRYVAELREYSAGTIIEDNVLHGSFLNEGASSLVAFVRAASGNCPALTVRRNDWQREPGVNEAVTRNFLSVDSVADTTTYPDATWNRRTIIRENTVANAGDLTAHTVIAASQITLTGNDPMQSLSSVGSTNLATSGTEYVPAAGAISANGTEANRRTFFTDSDIRVTRFRAALGTVPGVGASRTFTVRQSGTDTVATVTISDAVLTATWAGDLIIPAGVWVTISSVAANTPAASLAGFVIEYYRA